MSEENVVWLVTGLLLGGIVGAGMQFLNQQLGNSHHSLSSSTNGTASSIPTLSGSATNGAAHWNAPVEGLEAWEKEHMRDG